MVGADPGVRVPGLKAYKSPELRTEKFLISGKKKKLQGLLNSYRKAYSLKKISSTAKCFQEEY